MASVSDALGNDARLYKPSTMRGRLQFAAILILGATFYVVCLNVADISLVKLWQGLPRLANWASRAWPPDVSEIGTLTYRAAETVAMATVGVSFGALISVPICFFAARNLTPSIWLYYPARWFLNMLRGIDAFVFALIFVAAVGLGPFAGVLGISLHVAGSIAKLWAEQIETAEAGPLEAATMSGASRLKVGLYALLPDVMPSLASILLYMWEFNVRSSTVLGIVGAGGIGQELKNSMDLLQFDRLLTILLIILAMVTAIDTLTSWLRRKLF